MDRNRNINTVNLTLDRIINTADLVMDGIINTADLAAFRGPDGDEVRLDGQTAASVPMDVDVAAPVRTQRAQQNKNEVFWGIFICDDS